MKVVINACYGGYSLSPKATKELAKRKGRECYFFTYDLESKERYIPISVEEAKKNFIWSAYSVPNPQDYRLDERAEEIFLSELCHDRSDKDLVEIVENMKDEANGLHSKLKIVEIPDDIEWIIEEYDGFEHVAEAHRTWS